MIFFHVRMQESFCQYCLLLMEDTWADILLDQFRPDLSHATLTFHACLEDNGDMSSEITNYDVLLARDANGYCMVMDFEHVGNRRFTVLCDIHRERYIVALGGNDTTECERLVDKIVYTVCNECVPNGRFLEQVPPNVIRQLYPPEIKLTVHLSLGGAPPETAQPPLPLHHGYDALENAAMYTEITRHQSALQRSLSESRITFPPPLNGVHHYQRSHSESHQPIQHADPTTSNPDLNFMASLSNAMPMDMVTSASLPPLYPDRRAFAQQVAALWTSAPNLMSNLSASCMDVVFTHDCESLSTLSHAGNNRFRVLMDLQTKSYQDAGRNVQEKDKILDDMLRSVESWNGHFLREADGRYQVMTSEQAKESLRRILGIHSLRTTEIDVLKARKQKKESIRKMAKEMATSDSNLNCNAQDDDATML